MNLLLDGPYSDANLTTLSTYLYSFGPIGGWWQPLALRMIAGVRGQPQEGAEHGEEDQGLQLGPRRDGVLRVDRRPHVHAAKVLRRQVGSPGVEK